MTEPRPPDKRNVATEGTSSVQERFAELADPHRTPTYEELDALFDQAEPVDDAFMLGDWQGGAFGVGHPIEKQLAALKWAGKSFVGPDDVSPIVCLDDTGRRFVNPILGDARLRSVRYRGSVTATMIYDSHPILDHFRKISDSIVIGAMDRKGSRRTAYFFLTRIAPGGGSPQMERAEGLEPQTF